MDGKQAADWFRKAAEKGDAKAQANLGLLYSSGIAGERDLIQAYAWLKLSADKGEATGSVPLAEIKTGMTPTQVQEGERLAKELRARIEAPRKPAAALTPQSNRQGQRAALSELLG